MQPENETKTASPGNGESEDGKTSLTDPGQATKSGLLDPDSSAKAMTVTPDIGPDVIVPLSDLEMVEVAKELGLTRWKPSRTRAFGAIGDYLIAQGAVRVSAGEYVFSNDIRMGLIEECRERLTKTKDPELYAALMSQMNALLNAKDQATKQIIDAVKSNLIKNPESDTGPKVPPKGVSIAIIQNNSRVE